MPWKYVTDNAGVQHMINLDQVVDINRDQAYTYTVIVFAGGRSIDVKETPNEIAMAEPLRFK